MNNVHLRLATAFLLVAAAFILDIFPLRGEVLTAAPYLVTVAVSAYLLDSRRMIIVAFAAVLAQAGAAILQQYSAWVSVGAVLTVAITAGLAVAITRKTEQELLLKEEAAAAERERALAKERERLLEEVSAKRQEAEEAVRQRDIFLSVASHELKTPLTSLLGFSQLITKQLDQGGNVDTERLSRAVQVVANQTNKLARLINQLLDVSRIQTGKLELDKKLIDLVQLVRDTISDVVPENNGHEVRLSVPDSLEVEADPMRLEQVLTNLLTNAIKFSPNGGIIEVKLSVPDCKWAYIIVRDHGVGVPPEHRAGIFGQFYQAHKPMEFGGMGLGLFISSEIVEMHGGTIRAEFPEDGGTRFVVSLPISGQQAPAQ